MQEDLRRLAAEGELVVVGLVSQYKVIGMQMKMFATRMEKV